MSVANRALSAGAIAAIALACSGCDPKPPMDLSRFSGTFVHETRVESELREISLPKGEVLKHMKFPSAGEGSLVDLGGLSICAGSIVAALEEPEGMSSLISVDLTSSSIRVIREGWRPSCGPRDTLFFFSHTPGMRGSDLVVAPLADPSRSKLLIHGAYGWPQKLVFIENRYMATYDPSTQAQVVFEITSDGVKKVWAGGDCQPLFWRTRTSELVCEDTRGAYRSQRLMKEPGAILIDAKDEDVRGVLYYWPSEDAILSTRIRTTWDLREYQDLIVVDLRSHEVATLLSHVNVNVHTFTLAGN